jgi:protoporphyrinogen oxidase
MGNKYDVIIAGSGISGMSMAYYCAKNNLKVLVIEKNDSLGGSFTTKEMEDYWLELGAHTMYNSYSNLIDIIEGCGIADEMIKRKKVPYKVLKNGKIHSVISQTVESYYSRIVGKYNYRKFFQYMFNAVPSQPTNEFPADILFKKRSRRKDILKSFTFKTGIKSIIDSISAISGIDTLVGSPIASVDKKNNTYVVTMQNQQTCESDQLVFATPVDITADLIKDINPGLSQLIKKIDHVNTDSVGIVVKKEAIDLKEVAGIIGIDAEFYSVVSRDVVEDGRYRGFVFHFKPDKFNNQSKIEFICKTLAISGDSIVQSYFIQNTVPSYKSGQDSIVTEIDSLLQADNIFLTGNYFYGMAIEDCVSRSLQEYRRLQNFRK